MIDLVTPRWHLVYARAGMPSDLPSVVTPARVTHETIPPEVARDPVAGRIARTMQFGSVGLALGAGWGEPGGDAGFGGTVTLAADFPSGLSIGLESGKVEAGPQERPKDAGPVDVVYRSESHLVFGGGLARYAIRVGPVQPYVVAGLAGYTWEDGFLGASLGAGVALPLPKPQMIARLEYRRHDNIQNLVGVDPGFATLTMGAGYYW